jgi:hypothetical protein
MAAYWLADWALRLNNKTVTPQVGPQRWRVAYSLLHRVVESGASHGDPAELGVADRARGNDAGKLRRWGEAPPTRKSPCHQRRLLLDGPRRQGSAVSRRFQAVVPMAAAHRTLPKGGTGRA